MKEFFKYISTCIANYKRYVFLHVVFSLLSALFALFSIALVVPFLGILFGKHELTANAEFTEFSFKSIIAWMEYSTSKLIVENGASGKSVALLYICISFAVLVGMKAVFDFLSSYFLAPIRTGITKIIRIDMYNRILHLPLSFFSKTKKGQIVSRMTNDVREVEASITQLFQSFIQDPLVLTVYFVAMLIMNMQLTLIVLIVLPIVLLGLNYMVKRLKANFFVGMKRIGIITSVLDETLYNLKTIRAFNAEEKVRTDFMHANTKYADIMQRVLWKRAAIGPVSEMVIGVLLLIIIWYGGNQVLDTKNNFKPQEFLAYILLFTQITPYGKRVMSFFANASIGAAAFQRVFDLFENISPESKHGDTVEQFSSEIKYDNVSFSYESQTPVLTNISFTIQKGEMVAIVGQSGSGKTTLADLLPCFYIPNQGSILIDGKKTTNISLQSLRHMIGYVNQEPLLFNDTILNNLLIGNQHATYDEVVAAAKIAHAHEFIESFPEGYKTIIGDRGVRLSGGQRQRLTIARAILKNPPILIFDEATSALDTESEQLVRDALKNLMNRRTSLVIAHRLSTIYHADKIIVLDKGYIVEQGTHAELIVQNGFYKRLFDLQVFV